MRRVYRMVSAALLAGMILACPAIADKEVKQSQAARPAPAVDIYRVGKARKIPVTLEYSTRLASVQSAFVAARITGVLVEKHYTEGSYVHKGDLLYTIEPDIYREAVNKAEAALELEKAKWNKVERDWKRAEGLHADNTISDQERDAALAAYESASASVKIAKAALQSAMIDLGYTDVKATIDGISGMKLRDVGNRVEDGTQLVEITKIDPIYAEFSIPDIDIIKKNYSLKERKWENTANGSLKATLNINGTSYEYEGSVDFLSPKIDPQTGTLKARAVFKNPDKELIPGTFARITVKGLVRKESLTVPQKAVMQNQKGTVVFVVEDGKVAVRKVKLGGTEEENYIVDGLLYPGDKVIVNNLFRIKPGMSVVIDKTVNSGDR